MNKLFRIEDDLGLQSDIVCEDCLVKMIQEKPLQGNEVIGEFEPDDKCSHCQWCSCEASDAELDKQLDLSLKSVQEEETAFQESFWANYYPKDQ